MSPTTEVRLQLATPLALRAGLALAGWTWGYRSWPEGGPSTGHLYAWGAGDADDSMGVLYIGIDQSADGGRLSREHGWTTDEYIHAHGLTMQRLHARAVSGAVAFASPDLSWISADPATRWAEALEADWPRLTTDRPGLRLAEQFAIRLSVHLGDVGAPVNSQHKSAWDLKGDAAIVNRLAVVVASELRSRDIDPRARG